MKTYLIKFLKGGVIGSYTTKALTMTAAIADFRTFNGNHKIVNIESYMPC